jgi:Flp pilus assembly protein TadD
MTSEPSGVRALLVLSFLFIATAVPCLGQAASVAPQTAEDWQKAGDEYARNRATAQQAIDAYTEAIRLKPDMESAYLKIAARLLILGRSDERTALLLSAHEILPGSTEIMKAAARTLIDSRSYEDLVRLCPEYLKLQPGDAYVRNDYGWALMQLNRHDEAISVLEPGIASDGQSGQMLHNLAAAYWKTGRLDEALRTYERILEAQPDHGDTDSIWVARIELLVKLNRSDDAATLITKRLEEGADDGLGYYLRARLKLHDRAIPEAVADLKKAEEIGVSHRIERDLHADLGWAYMQLARHTDAIEELKQASDMNPESFIVHANLALAYAKSSQCEKAMDPFEKAIRLKPEEHGIYNNMSLCLMKLGRLDDAERGLRYAIQLSPDNPAVRVNLSSVLIQQNRLDEAESELRKAIKLRDPDWRVYAQLGALLGKMGKTAETIPIYRECLRLHPDEPMILNNLGYALLQTGARYEEALEIIQCAVNKAPANAAFRDSLGWAYFKLGRFSDAEREISEASQKEPNSDVFEHLGDVQEKLGKKSESLVSWKKALSLTSDEAARTRLQAKLGLQ